MCGTKTQKDDVCVKDFKNLRARFKLQGHRLYRTNPEYGRVLYFIERLGPVQPTNHDIAMDVLAKLEAR